MSATAQNPEACSVVVSVRCRPFNERERLLKSVKCIEFDERDKQTLRIFQGVASHNFKFDHSYDEGIAQEQLFLDIGVPVIEGTFDGFNTCIFAYGQTGSGKSYCMMGPASVREDASSNAGLIPRVCRKLFADIASRTEQNAIERENFPNPESIDAPPELVVEVQVTYLEIYQERVKCLLNPAKENLKVRQHPTMGVFVEDLTKIAVSDHSMVWDLIEGGNSVRHVAATNMNERSSRSHAIFTLIVTQKRIFRTKLGEKISERVAKVNLVDLAGSERAKSTGAEGDTLREGSNINKSLTILGLVISGLAESSKEKGGKKPFIPYRDSQLTWLLKENLGGNSKTFMISTLSPADVNYEETLSTLRYADRAKAIVTKAFVNEDPTAKLIRELREQIEFYQKRLQESEAEKERLKRPEAVPVLNLTKVPMPIPKMSVANAVSGTSGGGGGKGPLRGRGAISNTSAATATSPTSPSASGGVGSPATPGQTMTIPKLPVSGSKKQPGGGGHRHVNMPMATPRSAINQVAYVESGDYSGEGADTREDIEEEEEEGAPEDAEAQMERLREQAEISEKLLKQFSMTDEERAAQQEAEIAARAEAMKAVEVTIRAHRDEPYVMNLAGAGDWVLEYLVEDVTYIGTEKGQNAPGVRFVVVEADDVEPRHCCIIRNNGKFSLQPLQGGETFVDDEEDPIESEVLLTSGQTIQCGDFVNLKFVDKSAPIPTSRRSMRLQKEGFRRASSGNAAVLAAANSSPSPKSAAGASRYQSVPGSLPSPADRHQSTNPQQQHRDPNISPNAPPPPRRRLSEESEEKSPPMIKPLALGGTGGGGGEVPAVPKLAFGGGSTGAAPQHRAPGSARPSLGRSSVGSSDGGGSRFGSAPATVEAIVPRKSSGFLSARGPSTNSTFGSAISGLNKDQSTSSGGMVRTPRITTATVSTLSNEQNIAVHRGMIVVLGDTGSGKSALVSCLQKELRWWESKKVPTTSPTFGFQMTHITAPTINKTELLFLELSGNPIFSPLHVMIPFRRAIFFLCFRFIDNCDVEYFRRYLEVIHAASPHSETTVVMVGTCRDLMRGDSELLDMLCDLQMQLTNFLACLESEESRRPKIVMRFAVSNKDRSVLCHDPKLTKMSDMLKWTGDHAVERCKRDPDFPHALVPHRVQALARAVVELKNRNRWVIPSQEYKSIARGVDAKYEKGGVEELHRHTQLLHSWGMLYHNHRNMLLKKLIITDVEWVFRLLAVLSCCIPQGTAQLVLGSSGDLFLEHEFQENTEAFMRDTSDAHAPEWTNPEKPTNVSSSKPTNVSSSKLGAGGAGKKGNASSSTLPPSSSSASSFTGGSNKPSSSSHPFASITRYFSSSVLNLGESLPFIAHDVFAADKYKVLPLGVLTKSVAEELFKGILREKQYTTRDVNLVFDILEKHDLILKGTQIRHSRKGHKRHHHHKHATGNTTQLEGSASALSDLADSTGSTTLPGSSSLNTTNPPSLNNSMTNESVCSNTGTFGTAGTKKEEFYVIPCCFVAEVPSLIPVYLSSLLEGPTYRFALNLIPSFFFARLVSRISCFTTKLFMGPFFGAEGPQALAQAHGKSSSGGGGDHHQGGERLKGTGGSTSSSADVASNLITQLSAKRGLWRNCAWVICQDSSRALVRMLPRSVCITFHDPLNDKEFRLGLRETVRSLLNEYPGVAYDESIRCCNCDCFMLANELEEAIASAEELHLQELEYAVQEEGNEEEEEVDEEGEDLSSSETDEFADDGLQKREQKLKKKRKIATTTGAPRSNIKQPDEMDPAARQAFFQDAVQARVKCPSCEQCPFHFLSQQATIDAPKELLEKMDQELFLTDDAHHRLELSLREVRVGRKMFLESQNEEGCTVECAGLDDCIDVLSQC